MGSGARVFGMEVRRGRCLVETTTQNEGGCICCVKLRGTLSAEHTRPTTPEARTTPEINYSRSRKHTERDDRLIHPSFSHDGTFVEICGSGR